MKRNMFATANQLFFEFQVESGSYFQHLIVEGDAFGWFVLVMFSTCWFQPPNKPIKIHVSQMEIISPHLSMV